MAALDTSDIIRACVDSWSSQQNEYTQHMGESLAALEAYQHYLDEWQRQIEQEARQMDDRRHDLERQRREIMREQCDDSVLVAQLDQARSEIRALREQLMAAGKPADTGPSPGSQKRPPEPTTVSHSTTDTFQRSMNSVAKQFQKLRSQQAARRAAQGPSEGGAL
jgi:hypothetical protein